MTNDTMRVGDRAVPLAEIPDLLTGTYIGDDIGFTDVAFALFAEVRRLRAVEEAALRVIAVAREREVSATGDLWKAIAQMSLVVDPLPETGGTDA